MQCFSGAEGRAVTETLRPVKGSSGMERSEAFRPQGSEGPWSPADLPRGDDGKHFQIERKQRSNLATAGRVSGHEEKHG